MSNSPLRRVRLPVGFPGQLYLTHMPGYYRSVEIHTVAWSQFPAGTQAYLLCLAGKSERRRKSPDYPKFLEAVNLGERWIEFPTRDRSVPTDLSTFLQLLDRLAEILVQPDHLLAIHCAAGVGRTGTVATALLVRLGLTPEDALAAVVEARSEPETPRQLRFALSIPSLSDLVEIYDRLLVRRLLAQFDQEAIRRELLEAPEIRPGDLVEGETELARLMRCIQVTDIEFRGRSLNEIVEQELSLCR